MNIWKKLFGEKPDPMAEEIRRLDAIEAIDPRPRKEEYWRKLHPLVQAGCVYRVGWDLEKELSIDTSDAYAVFHHWGYPSNSYTYYKSERQTELMERYGSQKEALWQQLKAAESYFGQSDAEAKKEKERSWKAYWEHYAALSPGMQSLVAWELAKRGASRGKSGFHGAIFGSGLPFPFAACGWASYREPGWGDTEGVAFRINRDCFGSRKPLLYYLDDDNWPWEDREKTHLAIIESCSSGISGVRTERRRCVGWDGEEKERQVVLFRLDPKAVKETVLLSGKPVPTAQAGEYIFVLPRAGEFYCLLGEVRDGEMIPLHKDDFCMK